MTLSNYVKNKESKLSHIKKEKQLRGRYKMSSESYMDAFGAQGGKCAICNKKGKHVFDELSPRSEKLCVDHCHKSGKARALICNHCNKALGLFMDDKRIVENALNYLKFFEITDSDFLCDVQENLCNKQAGELESLATIKQVWSITHHNWIIGSPPRLKVKRNKEVVAK